MEAQKKKDGEAFQPMMALNVSTDQFFSIYDVLFLFITLDAMLKCALLTYSRLVKWLGSPGIRSRLLLMKGRDLTINDNKKNYNHERPTGSFQFKDDTEIILS